jgi:hypothetical protein
LPENNLFIPVRRGEQLTSQRDIEFSTSEIEDCAAREADNARRAKDCDLQWHHFKRRRESAGRKSVILLQQDIYDTINFAAATQRKVNVVNEVVVQCSVALCSLARIAAMSSVSSSPFRAKAVCPKWTYLRAMTAKR